MHMTTVTSTKTKRAKKEASVKLKASDYLPTLISTLKLPWPSLSVGLAMASPEALKMCEPAIQRFHEIIDENPISSREFREAYGNEFGSKHEAISDIYHRWLYLFLNEHLDADQMTIARYICSRALETAHFNAYDQRPPIPSTRGLALLEMHIIEATANLKRLFATQDSLELH